MVCEHCKERDAVVNLTKIKDNTVTHQHLCERCAAEQGVETTVVQPKTSALTDFLQAVNEKATAVTGDQAACHFCGATARDFRQSGRVGCARCYGAFERSLRELLRRLHNATRHTGRRYVPPAADLVEQAGQLDQLRDRLQRAIDAEQFELAAELRDRLRAAGAQA